MPYLTTFLVGLDGNLYDDGSVSITFVQAPEPGTALLLVAGLVALGARRRSRP